jgi:hypothetical protein
MSDSEREDACALIGLTSHFGYALWISLTDGRQTVRQKQEHRQSRFRR